MGGFPKVRRLILLRPTDGWSSTRPSNLAFCRLQRAGDFHITASTQKQVLDTSVDAMTYFAKRVLLTMLGQEFVPWSQSCYDICENQ